MGQSAHEVRRLVDTACAVVASDLRVGAEWPRAIDFALGAVDTTKNHTLITLGISDRTKPLVLKSRKRCPCGFDSHRPLHFSLSGVSLRCPRTQLSFSPSSHSLDAAATVPLTECVDRPLGRVRSRWSHPTVIDPEPSDIDDRSRVARITAAAPQRFGFCAKPTNCDTTTAV
jgi:hypothetical protein